MRDTDTDTDTGTDTAGLRPEEAAATADARLAAVAEATGHLLRTVAALDPAAVTGPSALPGWTRGHILAHLARNADSLLNLLEAARTGTDIPQYATLEARDQGIEDGAPGRPPNSSPTWTTPPDASPPPPRPSRTRPGRPRSATAPATSSRRTTSRGSG